MIVESSHQADRVCPGTESKQFSHHIFKFESQSIVDYRVGNEKSRTERNGSRRISRQTENWAKRNSNSV